MCANCGCMIIEDDMGNPKNITLKTIEEAADAEGQSVEDALRNIVKTIQKHTDETTTSAEPKPE